MRSVAVAFTLALFAAGAALAAAGKEVVWVASGAEGGTYADFYARNLAAQMPDYRILPRRSTGSQENLRLLAEAEVQLAFAQADAYASWLAANPERQDDLLIVGRLADECVYVAVRTEGPVRTLAQLEAPVEGRAPKIALGPADGGMSGTWRYLVGLEPGLAAAEVLHDGDTLALNQLAVGRFDAVAWVTDPMNLDHKLLRAVHANDALELMDLDSAALESALPDGTRIHERKRVETDSGRRPKSIETVCTSALLLARSDIDKELLRKLADLVGLHLDRLLPPRKR
jgi:TRAP-type uncharacterized transport system substrate-binding protein